MLTSILALAVVATTAQLTTALPTTPPTITVEKRSTPLSCVEFQYGGPFTSFGQDGFIHLYSNITTYDSETQTTSFNESRLGSYTSDDGTIEPCGDCRTIELWGFEVCQGPQLAAFNGFQNSATNFYGHITYRNYTNDILCLTAENTASYDGSSLILAPCQYGYDTVDTSGQYFNMEISQDGVYYAKLVDQYNFYGPNPSLVNGSSLTLYDGVDGTFTYFGFKAPVF